MRIIATNDLLGTVTSMPTSTGRTGSMDGVAAIVEAARTEGPVLWLDSGDLIGGPLWSLSGRRSWQLYADLRIDAMAVGNHELDEGIDAFRAGCSELSFPVLCADLDELELPSTALIGTSGGWVGIVGLTHPAIDRFVPTARPADTAESVRRAADRLRRAGARWVIALQHDGVDWWPRRDGIAVVPDRWTRTAGRWAESIDAVLGGHTLAAWSGNVDGTAFGQAHPFATSVLVVDLLADRALVRGTIAVASDIEASLPRRAAAELIHQAGTQIIGENAAPLSNASIVSGERSLPQVVAEAIRVHTKTDAAFVLSSGFFTQAPLDGASAALKAGPVSRLDLHRLFPFPADGLVVIELVGDELRRLVAAHDDVTNPANRDGDNAWWNWSRTPAGCSTTKEHPRSVTVTDYSLPLIAQWLGRSPGTERAGNARTALEQWFAR